MHEHVTFTPFLQYMTISDSVSSGELFHLISCMSSTVPLAPAVRSRDKLTWFRQDAHAA